MSRKKSVTSEEFETYIKCFSAFTRDDLAGMYAIANIRAQGLDEENKELKKRLAAASETIAKLKMAAAFDPELVQICDDWLNYRDEEIPPA